jgi:hypothetical protein
MRRGLQAAADKTAAAIQPQAIIDFIEIGI